jgi:hypothetical protein
VIIFFCGLSTQWSARRIILCGISTPWSARRIKTIQFGQLAINAIHVVVNTLSTLLKNIHTMQGSPSKKPSLVIAMSIALGTMDQIVPTFHESTTYHSDTSSSTCRFRCHKRILLLSTSALTTFFFRTICPPTDKMSLFNLPSLVQARVVG